jgi:hypothetical protein
MIYRLLFVHNPHDARSIELRQSILSAGLQDEVTVVDMDAVKNVLPIQAVPCCFIICSDDMLVDFNVDAVRDNFQFMKKKIETEQVISDMADLLSEGGIL